MLRNINLKSIRTLISISLILIAIFMCMQPIYLYSKAILAQYLLQRTWIEVQQQASNTQNISTTHIIQKAPWPSADTYPVAKLSLIKKPADRSQKPLNINRISSSQVHSIQTNSDKNMKPNHFTEEQLVKQALIENSTQRQTSPIQNTTQTNKESIKKHAEESKVSWIILAGMTGRTMAFGPGWLQQSAKPNHIGNTVISAHNDSHFAILEHVNIGDVFILEDQQNTKQTYQINEIKIVNDTDDSVYQFNDQRMLTLITCYPFSMTAHSKHKRLVITAIAT